MRNDFDDELWNVLCNGHGSDHQFAEYQQYDQALAALHSAIDCLERRTCYLVVEHQDGREVGGEEWLLAAARTRAAEITAAGPLGGNVIIYDATTNELIETWYQDCPR